MTMDWDDLRVFLAVARAGSLRNAAARLKVNHATVSRAIQRIEERLETRLFDRSPGGLALSAPGDLLLPHAERMEQQVYDLSRKVASVDSRPSGTVRVSLPPFMAQGFIAPIVARFARAFPDIEVQLEITNTIADLSRQEADVSIRAAHEVTDNVIGRRLVRYLICAYVSPAYLEDLGTLAVGDGTGAAWIGWGGPDDLAWVANGPFPNAGIRHAFPEVIPQLEGAAAGLGIAWLPCFIGDLDARLVRAPGVQPQPDRSIWLLLHDDLRKTARVRAFVDFVSADIVRMMKPFIA
ncbi:MAG: LysR family transcriptional regulator [Bauldia litoralis]|uniref:LysR family transcriptional regulator n=2 Tax=Bauldia litoralis TaxID=665467 RepID=UPI00329800E2